VFCLLVTCFVVSIICMLQIPGGGRVSAPFEGETGEPNTLGGYLVFMGMIALGLLARTENLKIKQLLIVLLVAVIPPFLFTQSRSSYLAFIPALLTLGLLLEKRAIMVGLILIALVVSPLFLPAAVKDRILFTFTQREHPGQQVTIGNVRLDTSTTARLRSYQDALNAWTKQPMLGYGVTGHKFLDAQFPRVLVETGVIGLAAFIFLLYSIFKLATTSLKELKTPYLQGLTIGFLAGYIGLLFHAIGANTFIIVRIMEPFWFMAGIIAVLPQLEKEGLSSPEPLRQTKFS
jgi:O-antigen ligase